MTEASPSWRDGVAKFAITDSVSRCSNHEGRVSGANEKAFSLTGANRDDF